MSTCLNKNNEEIKQLISEIQKINPDITDNMAIAKIEAAIEAGKPLNEDGLPSIKDIDTTIKGQLPAEDSIVNISNIVSSEGTTKQYGVVIDNNLKSNYPVWQQNNPDGIVAYRVNFSEYNTPEEALAGRIGNPFSEGSNRGKNTVKQFFIWLTTGENFGNNKATEEYRQAIISKLLSTPINSPILYYTELGRPSHATVLGYLINHKELITNSKDSPQPTNTIETTSSSVESSQVFNSLNTDITLAERDKTDLSYDPQTRRARVELISRQFSVALQAYYNLELQKLEQQLVEAEKNNDTSAVAALAYTKQHLTKLDVLKKYTPRAMFEYIRNNFTAYINTDINTLVQSEFKALNIPAEDVEKYRESITKKVTNRQTEFRKLLDNFRPLAEEACINLTFTEGIIINLDNVNETKAANTNEDDVEGNSELDELSEELGMEERSYKDGWMTKFRSVSSKESLSALVRKVLGNIRKTTVVDGKETIEVDDLGYPRYYNSDYVHAVLIDKLRHMTSPKDMMSILENLSNTKSWVKDIIKYLNSNETFKSQFYYNFRKDFTSYWIMKKKLLNNGTYKFETVSLNKPEGTYYLLDSWRDNHEYLNYATDNPIFTENNDTNIENAKILLEDIGEIRKKLTKVENSNIQDNGLYNRISDYIGKNTKIITDVYNALLKIGADTDKYNLEVLLTTAYENMNFVISHPVNDLLNNIEIIAKGVSKNGINNALTSEKSNSVDTEDITSEEEVSNNKYDLINFYGTAFNTIANTLNTYKEDIIESSVRELGKSYYAHNVPNYLGKVIKKLKNVNGNVKDFDEYIKKEFLDYDWFCMKDKTGKFTGFRNDILNKLVNYDETTNTFTPNLEYTKILDHKVVLHSDKVDYTNWDSLDYTTILVQEFLSDPNERTMWMPVPILSDSPSAEFIKWHKYGNSRQSAQEEILPILINLVKQEINRMTLVKNRDLARKNGKTIYDIANFDKRGKTFCFLTELNTFRLPSTGKTLKDSYNELLKDKDKNATNIESLIEEAVTEVMEYKFDKEYKKWVSIGLLDKVDNNSKGAYKYLPNKSKSDIEKLLEDYYWNHVVFTAEFIQIMTTDLAYYKSTDDFQKRFKEIHAPANKLNTEATWKGELVGREYEKTMYLKDIKISTSLFKEIEAIVLSKYNNGEISAYDAASIIAKYGISNEEKDGKKYYSIKDNGNTIFIPTEDINVVDGQAYRSLSSYRRIMIMAGQWNDAMETAYKDIKAGTFRMENFNIMFQPKKPYVYTQIKKTSPYYIKGADGKLQLSKTINNKVPMQNKNSEFLLLAMSEVLMGKDFTNSALGKISAFIENNDIDVIQFESAVKVGNQCPVDLNGQNAKEIESLLNEAYKQKEIFVHELPYEDYGFQTEVPEHSIDAVQLVGTQLRKLIHADMPDDMKITIKMGKTTKTLTKKEWLNYYQRITTENIVEQFLQINDMFSSKEKISKILQEEIRSNNRYGMDLLKACTLNENGDFNISLYDPTQSLRVQQLLNSIIRSRVTKQKIKGGSLVQVTSYGLNSALKIVFKDSEGNEVSGEDAKNRKDLSIAYYECMMPAYSKEFFKPFMVESDGGYILDVAKLKEAGLDELIGYRIPTEDKYSMLPLKIVGFLPVQSGSAIMLPAEITTITGSDFDIDKLYIMLPEFKVLHYNYTKARKDFKNDLGVHLTNTLLNAIEFNSSEGELEEEFFKDVEFKEWWQNLSDEDKSKYAYKEPKFVKIQYNYSTDKNKIQSRAARNNALIDLMWGVLTHKDTAFKMLNPGGYDMQKKVARIISILENIQRIEDLKREDIKKVEDLFKLSISELNNLNEQFTSNRNTLDPSTQVYLHQRNMNGAKLVGIYANHNASHALFQLLEGEKSPKIREEKAFTLYGKKLTKLNNITNEEGNYITRVVSGFLAASVDNGKDAFLSDLNQNTITADMTMLLARLGYSALEIGLFMAQPICKHFVNAINRQKGQGKSKKDIMEDILYTIKSEVDKMKDKYQNDSPYTKASEMTVEDMAKNILNNNIYKELIEKTIKSDTPSMDINYLNSQYFIGLLFKEIFDLGDSLSQLVQATRADTSNGGAGPTIADNIIKIEKVRDVMLNGDFPIENADIIDVELVYNPENDTRESIIDKIMENKVPYLQAFYTLGLSETKRLFDKYFPFYQEEFLSVITEAKSLTRYGTLDVKTMNSIYNDAITYMLNSLPFFGVDTDSSIDAYSKRKAFITDFPGHFSKMFKEDAELQKNEFLRRLKYQKKNKYSPVPLIIFKNVGHLTSILRDKYTKDWETLLYSNKAEHRRLALELFLYSYYRSGFAFGPSTFSHLAPLSLRKVIPGYQQKLRELLNTPDNLEIFFEQYIYNHLDNRKLVPQVNIDVDNTSTDVFIRDKDNPKKIKGVKETFTVTFSSTTFSSKSSDRSFIKSTARINDKTIYSPYKYIAVKYSNTVAYYKLVDNEHEGDFNTATYTYKRIAPLGHTNTFLEYEYGVPVSKMKSVIATNDYNELSPEAKKLYEQISDQNEALSLDTPELDGDYGKFYESANQLNNSEGVPITTAKGDFRDANGDITCQ